MLKKIGLVSYICTGMLLIAALCAVLAAYAARNTQHMAEEFVNDIRTLQVGKSSLQELTAIRRKYASYSAGSSSDCSARQCIVGVELRNTWLARLQLARPAGLGGYLDFENGSLQTTRLSAACYGRSGGPPHMVIVTQELPSDFLRSPFLVGGTQSDDLRNYTTIHLTPAATMQQREQAYAFDMNFLARLGPCYDATSMLPTPK